MIAACGAVLSVATLLAAGGVVDVAVATEARATQPRVDDPAIDTTQAQGGFVLRPSVSGAVRHAGFAGTLKYSPGLSMLARQDLSTFPEVSYSVLYSVLHSLEAGAEAELGPRARVRSTVVGSVGELDPASAQSALQGSSGVLDPLVALPYASLATRLGAGFDLSRRTALDATGTFDLATSLGSDRIPLTMSPGMDVSGSWQATRADALSAGVNMQGAIVDGRGGFLGGGPGLGWRRQLARDTGFALHGGVGAYSASDDESAPINVILPRATAELYTLLDLAGESALEAGTRAGVAAVNDPLGTLLENRVSLSVDGGIRFTRDVALRAELTTFQPAFAYAQRGPTASSTYGGRVALAWLVSDFVSVDAGMVLTTRVVEEKPSTDALVSIALSGTTPVWHTGGRPAGSGTRHRGIGVSQVGEPARPGATTVREPPPLEIPEDLPPPPLVPPAGFVDPNAAPVDPDAPPVSGTLRPLTDDEKRKAEEAKKKRREGDKPAEGDAPASGDAKEAPKEEAPAEATPQ